MSQVQVQATPLMKEEIVGLEEPETIILRLKDNSRSEVVYVELAKNMSGLIKTVLENNEDEKEIVLDNEMISGQTFDYFLDLMKIIEEHNDSEEIPILSSEEPLTTDDLLTLDPKETGVPKVFIEYITSKFARDAKDYNDLYKFMADMNYLQSQGVLHISCAYVATLLKGKSLEDCQKILKPNE